jgi:hypothetical protein
MGIESDWFRAERVRSTTVPDEVRFEAPIGHAAWSILFGTLAGGAGGLAMLAVAQHLLARQGSAVDLTRMLSDTLSAAGIRFGDVQEQGYALAGVLGAFAGASFGYLARRLLRVVPRLLFFAIVGPVAWLFLQTCVLTRLAPALAASLPFGPLAIGALAYGMCLAIVPPIRARRRVRA